MKQKLKSKDRFWYNAAKFSFIVSLAEIITMTCHTDKAEMEMIYQLRGLPFRIIMTVCDVTFVICLISVIRYAWVHDDYVHDGYQHAGKLKEGDAHGSTK